MYSEKLTVTTNSAGAATAYSNKVTGRIIAVIYTKDGAADAAFDDGVDFTLTSETTGQTIWTQSNVNASATVYPRAQVHSTAGVALWYEAINSEPVSEPVLVWNERIEVAIASGGDAQRGDFTFLLE